MTQFFKSVLEQELSPVVLCDTAHKILYMNPAAKKEYGEALIGKSVLDCHSPVGKERIRQVVAWFEKDPANNRVHTIYSKKDDLDVYMVALRDETGKLIGYYEKLESRTRDLTPVYQGVEL